jgi:lipopolysaccharide/colanic/teichoic acid biosynthesis glycosyltransferase
MGALKFARDARMDPSITDGQARTATVRAFERPQDLAQGLRLPPFNVPVAPEPHAGYNLAKRLIDIAGSAALLVVVLLPMLAIAIGIKLTSPGPVFFRQRRLGLGGREILFLKFRTMVKDAETRQHEVNYWNITNGPAFKHPHDPRITPLGRFLRRWSLDELPQVWNVIRGEMSLVGPRSLPVDQNRYLPGQDLRLSVKPGLTCTWQVSGRSTITFARWMEMDVEYVRNRSLVRDLSLVLRTVPAVLSGKGAM